MAGLALVLALASVLRFAGLGHNLRRAGPDLDELNNFVAPILRMWQEGTLDPTVYSGYAGAFNYVAFPAVVAGHSIAGEYGAFLGGRAVVATAGVASVLLVFLVGNRAFGYGAGLLAALLLGVSRVDVRSAHFIAPDVLVGSLSLVVLLLSGAGGRARRTALLMGVVTGLATAIKYNGLLLAPTALTALLVRRESRKTVALLLLAAALSFTLAAPYAVANLGAGEQGAGIAYFVLHYYGVSLDGEPAEPQERLSLGQAAEQLRLALGLPGLALAGLGALALAPRAVTLPAAVLALCTLAATIPAVRVYPRHMVPAVAPAALLAAAATFWLAGRFRSPWRRGATLVFLVAVLLWRPAQEAFVLARSFTVPTGPDRAASWIESLPGPAQVLAAAPFRFPLDSSRFEVLPVLNPDDVVGPALAHFDLIVVAPATRGERLVQRLGWPSRVFADPFGPRQVLILLRPPDAAPALQPLPGPVAGPGAVASVFDGDEATSWSGWAADQVELTWPTPTLLARVDIVAAPSFAEDPQDYVLQGSPTDTGGWMTLAVQNLRPVRPHRQGSWHSRGQAYVLTPARRLARLRIGRDRPGRWSVAEIQLLTPVEDMPSPPR